MIFLWNKKETMTLGRNRGISRSVTLGGRRGGRIFDFWCNVVRGWALSDAIFDGCSYCSAGVYLIGRHAISVQTLLRVTSPKQDKHCRMLRRGPVFIVESIIFQNFERVALENWGIWYLKNGCCGLDVFPSHARLQSEISPVEPVLCRQHPAYK